MRLRLLLTLCCVVPFSSGPSSGLLAQSQSSSPTYNQLVSVGYDYLKEGKLKEAYISALEAAKSDSSRFEAYALAALVLSQQGIATEAKALLDKAVARAPAGKKKRLDEIARTILPAKGPDPAFPGGTRIYLKNTCDKKIHVAITYQFDGEWLTGGWWNVDPGQTAASAYTTNQNVYFYANSDDGAQWNGGNEKDTFTGYTVPTRFTMATDFPFSGGTQRTFFHRTIPDRSTNWTMEYACPQK
jgi:uncharacterized membrane protein